MEFLLPKQKTIIVNYLLKQQVGIIPTDTVYGIVGLWNSPLVAKKIYTVKGRDPNKLLPVLVSDMLMAQTIAEISPEIQKIFQSYPPGKVTLILNQKTVSNKTIAIRITNDGWLKDIINQTGPLVATSANRQNQPPITRVIENDLAVDFIVDGGYINNSPSTIVDVTGSSTIVIRS